VRVDRDWHNLERSRNLLDREPLVVEPQHIQLAGIQVGIGKELHDRGGTIRRFSSQAQLAALRCSAARQRLMPLVRRKVSCDCWVALEEHASNIGSVSHHGFSSVSDKIIGILYSLTGDIDIG
jgi:hypothetical protein